MFNHPAKEFYEDQLFSFKFEDVEVENVHWNLKDATASPSRVFTDSVFQNDSATPDEFSLDHPGGDGSPPRIVSESVFEGGFPLSSSVEMTSACTDLSRNELSELVVADRVG